jgi:hypothetical protein
MQLEAALCQPHLKLSLEASVAINSLIPQIAHVAKLEKPRLVSMTTSEYLYRHQDAITQQNASKACLTGSVHDVTTINARTSAIEEYTQYWGSNASALFVCDHRVIDNRAQTGLSAGVFIAFADGTVAAALLTSGMTR